MAKASITFRDKVLAVVRGIPAGTVLSYGEVARRAGNLKASRVVGGIMARNDDKTVPCHRVIRADGHVGEYNGLRSASGAAGKRAILMSEGYEFKN